jgi:hypothetical protein
VAPRKKSRDEAIGFVNDLCASLDDVRPEVVSMLERVTGLLKRAPRGERHSGGYRKEEVDCCS